MYPSTYIGSIIGWDILIWEKIKTDFQSDACYINLYIILNSEHLEELEREVEREKKEGEQKCR